MELKQKIITTLVIFICIIVLAVAGYLIFFTSGGMVAPPNQESIIENLFVAKQLQDIESLKRQENIPSCKKLYDTILLELKEDKTNVFLGDDTEENERQYNSLWRELNFAFIERFIVLANKYFEQSEWININFVNTIITEIKNNGFVERNTSIWSILQGFENNISCYNRMQNCINRTYNLVYSLPDNPDFPSNEISVVKNQKQDLENQTCKKNVNLLNE